MHIWIFIPQGDIGTVEDVKNRIKHPGVGKTNKTPAVPPKIMDSPFHGDYAFFYKMVENFQVFYLAEAGMLTDIRVYNKSIC